MESLVATDTQSEQQRVPAVRFKESEQDKDGENLNGRDESRINEVVISSCLFCHGESVKTRLRRGQGGNSTLKMNSTTEVNGISDDIVRCRLYRVAA